MFNWSDWLNWLGESRSLPCYAALKCFGKRQPGVSLADVTLLVGS